MLLVDLYANTSSLGPRLYRPLKDHACDENINNYNSI